MKMGETQQFASPHEALEHHGVKGMHWGVRKEDESSSDRASSKEIANYNAKTKSYMAAADQIRDSSVTPEQAAKNVSANATKFADKFAPSNGSKSRTLTPTEKKLLIGGVLGAGAIGGLYLAKKYGISGEVASEFKPGDKLSIADFDRLRAQSLYASWGTNGYVTKESFARPAFELPVGHTLHRLSAEAETQFGNSFGNGTYATHSLDDFNRYAVGFGRTEGPLLDPTALHHVSWQLTKPVKVPALTDVLGTVREVLAEEHGLGGHEISDKEVVEAYGKWSGGTWKEGTGYGGGGKLLEALKKKGYGAIVDEQDAGILGESPLLFFDTSSAGPKSSTQLTEAVARSARENLTEMHNRKT